MLVSTSLLLVVIPIEVFGNGRFIELIPTVVGWPIAAVVEALARLQFLRTAMLTLWKKRFR